MALFCKKQQPYFVCGFIFGDKSAWAWISLILASSAGLEAPTKSDSDMFTVWKSTLLSNQACMYSTGIYATKLLQSIYKVYCTSPQLQIGYDIHQVRHPKCVPCRGDWPRARFSMKNLMLWDSDALLPSFREVSTEPE